MKASKIVTTGAAAVGLLAAGTAAGAAVAGPVGSNGVIHGCYTPAGGNGYDLRLQNAGTNCPRGSTAISWNQKGRPGPAGPAGAGLTFTTASGVNGPAVTTAGTYFIDVTVGPENLTPSSMSFSCLVGVPSNPPGGGFTAEFGQTDELPAESSGDFTVSGMATLAAGSGLTVQCDSDTGPVTVDAATWYVAPITLAG
jgi:hypothetical protein